MFKLYKNLITCKNSTFYSLIENKGNILIFRRKHWKNIRQIEMLTADKTFEIKKDTKIKTYYGEDPRCFYHNNVLYVIDNYYCDMKLIDIERNLYLKLHVNAKNLSFISHNNKLYFIFYMKPFTLCELCIKNGKVREVISTKDNIDYTYRGGTPGYLKTKNIYYGFGHKTYSINGEIIHDIFLWEVDFNENPKINIKDIEQPPNSKKICDPTSVIEINNKKYLITAESDKPWFEEQDYYTNIYEFNFMSMFN